VGLTDVAGVEGDTLHTEPAYHNWAVAAPVEVDILQGYMRYYRLRCLDIRSVVDLREC
jgi:hypothetical protein